MIAIALTNLSGGADSGMSFKWLKLPDSEESIQKLLVAIGLGGKPYGEYIISDYQCQYENIRESLGELENLRALNELARQMTEMDSHDLDKLNAACLLRPCEGAVELLNLAYNLDIYEYLPAENDTALGEFEVESGSLKVPEHLINYIDYEAVGRNTRLNQGGAFDGIGYIFYTRAEFAEEYAEEDFPPLMAAQDDNEDEWDNEY